MYDPVLPAGIHLSIITSGKCKYKESVMPDLGQANTVLKGDTLSDISRILTLESEMQTQEKG